MTTPQISFRAGLPVAAFVTLVALLVLFGPLYGAGGGTVWDQGALARLVVLGSTAAALGALGLAAAGHRSLATGTAWAAVLSALVGATSVGALVLPGAIVVLVLLMRSTPS